MLRQRPLLSGRRLQTVAGHARKATGHHRQNPWRTSRGTVPRFLPGHPRRRWCSAARCGNRVRVARHYQRHRLP
ncbi:CGNR zinc finger domain-containing protein [Spirillospora sp. CA-128828]|uniref:CGNR zinc finger domain-containing protein n=1 Tax=Spirillospora sp. CA-128828 TaxID=3240033 RepID=UPI003D8EB090